VSWPREAFEALRQIVLIDERIKGLTDSVKELATASKDVDTRLHRLEAKFELWERMASSSRRSLPEKRQK
jgi:hypothetical protein